MRGQFAKLYEVKALRFEYAAFLQPNERNLMPVTWNEDRTSANVSLEDRFSRGTILQLKDGNQAVVHDASMNWDTLELGYTVEVSTGFWIRNFRFFVPDSAIAGLADEVDPTMAEATLR